MRMSSLRIELPLKLVIAWYVCVSCKMSSLAEIYHALSIMVGPRFLSAGLIIISSLVLRFQKTALMAALSSGLSLCIVSLQHLKIWTWYFRHLENIVDQSILS